MNPCEYVSKHRRVRIHKLLLLSEVVADNAASLADDPAGGIRLRTDCGTVFWGNQIVLSARYATGRGSTVGVSVDMLLVVTGHIPQ